MSYQLGIDLGTTYTAAAVCRSSDQRWIEPEVVNLGTRTATVPSVLFIAEDGSVVVGDAAERRALTDPDRVVREFKRRVGDPTPVVVAGRAWAAEELSARLVAWVVERVAEREGGPAARIAVTHPASWGAHKKELVAAALAGRGLAVTFLAEPQAAALHYAGTERVEAGSTIAVYDLGGGTFDAAVVRKGGPGVEGAGFGLLGRPEGLARLGGVDFDEVVFEHVRAGLPAAFEGLDEADPAVLAAVARVRRECTEAKEALSSDTEVVIPVLLPGSRGSVRLHRSEFEGMIRPRVEETVAALRRAVGSAGLGPEGLTAVLLVGGSSRIPLVAQLVSEQLGRPVAVDADPKNAIAKGAALALAPAPAAAPAADADGTGGFRPGPSATSGYRPAATPIPPPPPKGGLGAAAAGAAGFLAGAGTLSGASPHDGPDAGSPATDEIPTVPPAGGFDAAGGVPPRPPVRPASDTAPGYEYGDGYYDYGDEASPASRRSPVLLVGAGGAVAAVGVVAALLLWPQSGPESSANTRIVPAAPAPAPAPLSPEVTPVVTPEVTEAVIEPPAPTRPPRTNGPAPAPPLAPTSAAQPPPGPPPVTTTVPATTPSPPPPTTTAEPPPLPTTAAELP